MSNTNITDTQIEALQQESAGDLEMIAICIIALGGGERDMSPHQLEALTKVRGRDPGLVASQEAARAECARVIDAAKAMEEPAPQRVTFRRLRND